MEDEANVGDNREYSPIDIVHNCTGTVMVNSNIPTTWNVNGPSNYAASTATSTATYSNAPCGNYSINNVPVLSGYSPPSVSPGSGSVVSGGTLIFNISYTAESNTGDPPPSAAVTCSPANQTVAVNTLAFLSAAGGNGAYSWSAPGSNQGAAAGQTASFSYATTGSKTVSVTSNGQTANCGVSVVDQPPPPPQCTDNASIQFTTPLPASAAPGSTINAVIRVTNNGTSRWYHGDAYRFLQRSGLNIVVNPFGLNYGHLPAVISSGEYTDWSVAVTAPNTPNTTSTLTMQMAHMAGEVFRDNSNVICGSAPGVNTYFGQQASATFTTTAGDAPTVSLDRPLAGDTLSGSGILIHGWALDNSTRAEGPVTSVEIRLDGVLLNSNTYGTRNRQDVCDLLVPLRAGCPMVGFGFDWNSTTVANGPHIMTATAYDSSGMSATASRNFTVSNVGNVVVRSNLALASWFLNGASPTNVVKNYSGSGLGPVTYANVQTDLYTVSPVAVAGYNVAVVPSVTQTLNSGATITFDLNYTPQTGAVSVAANIPAGSWRINRQSDGVEVGTGSGTAAVNYTLPVGNYVLTANAVAKYLDPVPNPRNFTVSNSSTQSHTLIYSRITPGDPSDVTFSLAQCDTIRINWQDNSTSEDGFRVYYKSAPAGPRTLLATVAPNTETYLWNINVPDQQLWFDVQAFITYGPGDEEVSNFAQGGPTQKVPCNPDFSASSKTLTHISSGGGPFAPFQPSTAIKHDDLVRFRITIGNNGTSKARVNFITDTLSQYLVRPSGGWNVQVDKDADGVYNEGNNGENAVTIIGNAPNLTININGNKCTTANNDGCLPAEDPACQVGLCNNWVVYFDASVQATGPDVKAVIQNIADINYTYPIGSGNSANHRVQAGPFLIQTSLPRVPEFREVGP